MYITEVDVIVENGDVFFPEFDADEFDVSVGEVGGDDKFIGAGGISYFRVMPTYHNPTGYKAYIMNMYTVPEYRRKGVAYKTLDLLVAIDVSNGNVVWKNADYQGSGSTAIMDDNGNTSCIVLYRSTLVYNL